MIRYCCAILLLASVSLSYQPDLLERNSGAIYEAVKNEITAKEYNLQLLNVDSVVKPSFFNGVKYRAKLTVLPASANKKDDAFERPVNNHTVMNLVKLAFQKLDIPTFELTHVEYIESYSEPYVAPPLPPCFDSILGAEAEMSENGTLVEISTTTTTTTTTTLAPERLLLKRNKYWHLIYVDV